MKILFLIDYLALVIIGAMFFDDISGLNRDEIFAETIEFSGVLLKGESFNSKINENLYFGLLPYTEWGWIIFVGEDSSSNYVTVATPPFRGMNSTVIEGWHFRNEDNTGPNDGSVNAPQHVREFRFVLDKESFFKAEEYVSIVSWHYNYTQEELETAYEKFEELDFGNGELVITDMKFDNLERGERAGFEFIEFYVKIYMKGEKD